MHAKFTSPNVEGQEVAQDCKTLLVAGMRGCPGHLSYPNCLALWPKFAAASTLLVILVTEKPQTYATAFDQFSPVLSAACLTTESPAAVLCISHNEAPAGWDTLLTPPRRVNVVYQDMALNPMNE